jgi:hypothetical protein
VLLLESTENDVVANYIFINIDEVIAIDNTTRISLHLFVVRVWKQIPFFACVEKVSV